MLSASTGRNPPSAFSESGEGDASLWNSLKQGILSEEGHSLDKQVLNDVGLANQVLVANDGKAFMASFPQERSRRRAVAKLSLYIFRLTLVLRGGSARDHFEIGDAPKLGQDFILYAFGEISGVLVVAQILS